MKHIPVLSVSTTPTQELFSQTEVVCYPTLQAVVTERNLSGVLLSYCCFTVQQHKSL